MSPAHALDAPPVKRGIIALLDDTNSRQTNLLSVLKEVNLGQSGGAGQFCLRGIASNEHLGTDMLDGGDVDKIPSADQRKSSPPPALAFLRYRVRNTIAGFDTFLGAPDFGHDVGPAGLLGGGQRLNPPDGPAIAGDDQRLALLKLVQDRLGLLVQLFCGDYAHVPDVTP
jgi:hypothetical protein